MYYNFNMLAKIQHSSSTTNNDPVGFFVHAIKAEHPQLSLEPQGM